MSESQTSYRQIMKATSLFGGVQIFNIFISIIRSKFIAVLLGPAGMGIAGLLTSTTGLISGFTSFGLGTSAIKDVAAANASNNSYRISTVIKVLRRWVWITGLLGTLIILILSPWLSSLTFGNRDYTLAFVWISVTLLFEQLSSGQLVVLQGMRKLQYLAKANMAGSFLGLAVSVPIYYLYGVDGIVPAIILTSVTTMLLSWYFSGKVTLIPVKVSPIRTIAEGKGMMKMGFMISLTGMIGLGVAYLVRIFISHTGSVDQVGLYNAGFSIINTYVGLIFTAMSKDYYPRLSGVVKDNIKAKETINQQAEIAILILAPILSVFLVFINWIIFILYSNKFIAVSGMVHLAALGMFFKAVSWSIAYILLAKGASKLFFWNELAANSYLLLFNIAGYKFWGLEGLGISFFAGYLVYFVQVFFIAKMKYSFSLEKAFYKIFGIQFLLGFFCFLTVKLLTSPVSYITGTIFIIFSLLFSIRELDKRIDLRLAYTEMKKKISSRRK
jgi:O-antigen/teichoic acid export membrane protein